MASSFVSSALVLAAFVAIAIGLSWLSSRLSNWSDLARRFPSNTAFEALPSRMLAGAHVLALCDRPRVLFGGARGQPVVRRFSATSAGLFVEVGRAHAWHGRKALVPWDEVRVLAQSSILNRERFELALAGSVFLHVDRQAYEAISQFLSTQSVA